MFGDKGFFGNLFDFNGDGKLDGFVNMFLDINLFVICHINRTVCHKG